MTQTTYCSRNEKDYKVTLQACFIGTDGFVLASDTMTVMLGLEAITQRSSRETKICFDSTAGAAWCSSGHDICRRMCQRIKANWSGCGDDAITTFQNLLDGAVAWCRTNVHLDEQTKGNILFAAREGGKSVAVKCQIDWFVNNDSYQNLTKWDCVDGGQPFSDKALQGDIGNPAIFFAERYYRSDMTVRDLVPLAAHVILTGGQLNPYGVGGLEILLADDQGCRKLTEAELTPLRDASSRIDESIVQQFVSAASPPLR